VSLFVGDQVLSLVNVHWDFKPNDKGLTGGKYVLVNFSHLGTRAGCEYPHMTPTYIDNLCRLGLAEVPAFGEYTSKGVYDALESDPTIKAIMAQLEEQAEISPKVERKFLRVTELGKQFTQVCVVPKK
jgi:hypothetical protein